MTRPNAAVGSSRRASRAALVTTIAALAGCFDANELDAPQYATDVTTTYVDVGIPFDPRQRVDAGAGDVEPGADTPQADTPEEVTSECDDARPCVDPFVCVDGACVPECEAPEDCGEGSVCADFECVPLECIADADCEVRSETCGDGLCRPDACAMTLFVFDPGATSYASVHIAGSFNDWAPTIAEGGYALQLDPTTGEWWGKFEIANGSWEYKIVLDESETNWIADPANPDTVSDGFDGVNSLLTKSCSGGEGGSCGDLDAFDWRDAVMYFAMVDRFYDSDGRATPVSGASDGPANGASGQYEGGDLAGVTAKMDYLTELGVTALWLSAPYENRNAAGAAIDPGSDSHLYSAYHGYWPSPANIDYSDLENPTPRPSVESRLGTESDLRALVAAAHGASSANGHGVKVLFDYVMNHADIDSGLYAAHPDWFARRDGAFALCGPDNLWDDPFWGTRCAFTSYLPPFDYDNAAARRWSVDDAIWWASEFGIDGYRLDAIKHVPLSWLTDLRERVDSAFPEPDGGRFYLVGETFAYDDRDLIRRYVDPDTMLDGQFDFPLKARLCEAVMTGTSPMSELASWMTGNDAFYGDGALMSTWIGNHDIPRAIHFASRQIGSCREGSSASNGWASTSYVQPSGAEAYERLGLAFAVMLTNPGVPLIYYGDEVGLAGGGDPDNRRMMVWDDASLSAPQRALRARVAALARVRAENPVLSRGRRLNRSSNADTWVYSMVGCGDGSPDVTVAINRGDSAASVTIPAGSYVDLLSDEAVVGTSISVPARDIRLLRREASR
ncbi:MAG: hypothetical protein H6700_07005 [Myxococcales bacterium]|nr:hypothetical protein [Myxococcales bacterium]MCB9531496.1 hypothetical protein [Myxococcales bacterium]